MECTCCGRERSGLVALRCHPEIKVCRNCIGWLHSQTGLVESTPILAVGDMTQAIGCYETAGFTVREYEGGGYAFVSYDDHSVFDLTVPDLPPAHPAECYLVVPDVNQWHERLTNAGLGVSPLDDKPWGMREFTLTDLDGNRVRVGQSVD